ncbi:MAG: TrkH family potassium uptake protein [Bacteroidales bacterium]
MASVVNFPTVFKLISRNLFLITGALLVSAFVAFIYHESLSPFLIAALVSAFVGSIFHFSGPGNEVKVTLHRKDAYLTVTLSWLFISMAGSLPYILSGAIPSYIDALFESISGFTTTGSSILTDIEALPKSLLFWRSLTHWIGGIGIIVLVIIVMPTLHIGGYHLFTLESSLQEKILPKIKSVGFRLLLIYLVLTVVEIVLLWLGEMNLYDSVCHAFGTVATGGFSPKNTSIGGYSAYSQYVIMVFMLLAGTNFVIHYYLVKRNFRKIRANEEFTFYLGFILVLGSILMFILIFRMGKPLELAFREAFFQIISIVTCTGYATTDYLQWPVYAWMLIFFSMFLGGSTGSTAGGIKMVRHLVLFKNFSRIFRQLLSPKAIIRIRLNGRSLKESANNSIVSFMAIYFLVFAIGTFLLVFMKIDVKTAASSAATCMAGIGPGIGSVGPASNFAHLPGLAKIVLSMLMLFGRLEIYTILILFTRNFWRN